MFTGIIQAQGNVTDMQARAGDVRIALATGKLDMSATAIGDSIAVNGVCLTVVDLMPQGFAADVSVETLSRTTLGEFATGTPVNLETALTPSSKLGGHLVSGHVDGVGVVAATEPAGRSRRIAFTAPDNLARYIAEKGSICIDGVSLTVNEVQGAVFFINVVPHTLTETTLGGYQSGQRVNLEVDIIARYLERLLLGERAAEAGSRITPAFLSEHGFLK